MRFRIFVGLNESLECKTTILLKNLKIYAKNHKSWSPFWNFLNTEASFSSQPIWAHSRIVLEETQESQKALHLDVIIGRSKQNFLNIDLLQLPPQLRFIQCTMQISPTYPRINAVGQLWLHISLLESFRADLTFPSMARDFLYPDYHLCCPRPLILIVIGIIVVGKS